MRVCLVSHSAQMRGAERSLVEIAEAVISRGGSSFVLLPAAGPLEDELGRIGARRAVVPYRWWVDSRTGWRRFPKYLKTTAALPWIVWKLLSWNVDIVITNTATVPAGAIGALLCRKPHVWHLHEFGKEDHDLSYDFGLRVSANLVDRLSATVIVVSGALERFYSRYIPREKLRVVYPGAHPHKNVPAGDPVFLPVPSKLALVGALTPGKGQHDAISAVELLFGQDKQVQLALLGDGDIDYRNRLEERVRRSGLEKLVHFVGYVSDPSHIMRDADAILVCSRSEAFSAAPIEAMMLGKPVIGANAGGTPELVQDGLNGLLYKPGDVSDLAAKIRYLVENPEIARQMGENGRELAAERFTVERYTSGVLQVFEEVLVRTRRPS